MNRIYRLPGFIPFITMIFLNAFITMGHRELMTGVINNFCDDSIVMHFLLNLMLIGPFILVFSLSGYVGDAFPRHKVLRFVSVFNVILSFMVFFAYAFGLFYLSFAMTFLVGLESAFFVCASYAYLKQLVGKENLTWGNGAAQAFIVTAMTCSIFVCRGMFADSLEKYGTAGPGQSLESVSYVGLVFAFFSLVSLAASYGLPVFGVPNKLVFDRSGYFRFRLCRDNLRLLAGHDMILISVICRSVFWSVLSLLLLMLSHGSNELGRVSMFFALLGVIVGSVLAGRVSKNYIETGLIPLGAFIISIVLFVFAYDGGSWLNTLLFLFGFGGAIYIVPLNALMQFYADDDELSRVVAGSQLVQNVSLLVTLAVSSLLIHQGLSMNFIFHISAAVVLVTTLYMMRVMPFSLVRLLISFAIMQRYKLIVEGFSNLPKSGGLLLLGNHISFIDWAIIQMSVPRKVHFIIQRDIYLRWYIRAFIDFFGVITVSSPTILNAKGIIRRNLACGDVVCVFPEGVISKHGHLNEFSHDLEDVLKGMDEKSAVIVPFYIRGMWGSIFSRSNEQFRDRRRSFSKRNVSIAFGSRMSLHSSTDKIKAKVFEMSFKAWEHQCKNSPTLGSAFISSCKKGGGDVAVIDTAISISYRRLLTVCVIVSRRISRLTFPPIPPCQPYSLKKDCVGILLPSTLAGVICNFSSVLSNKIVVNLNYTAGPSMLSSQIEQANIAHVFTSRRFLSILESKNMRLDLSSVRLHYMEDVVSELKGSRLSFIVHLLLVSLLPTWILRLLLLRGASIDDTCAVLFSSGSEGQPKGVMLSHLNIMSNIAQIADVIHARNDDCMLASLPTFHSFGLTVTVLMPILENMPIVCYPDPTDSLGVAKAVVQNRVTIMFATSTMLGLYSRHPGVHKIMFDSIRATVAGAEKLKSEIKDMYALKFNKPIYEGYGATETTPVVSTNLPDEFDVLNWRLHCGSKEGSVGMPLPGTVIRIVDIDTLQELGKDVEGLILIGGHQVMQGYLNNETKTNEVVVELDGIRWYKSGDIGFLDKEGFLHITDRYSRFVKVGGEMVSLSNIEDEVQKILRQDSSLSSLRVCAVGLDDKRKGEKIVLLVEGVSDMFNRVVSLVKASSIPPLIKPKEYFMVDSIPLLGSGKVDLKGVKDLASSIDRKGHCAS